VDRGVGYRTDRRADHKGADAAMVKEFKEFVLRGNLLDLAVAVVIGAAFTGVVNAFVSNLITPLIKAVFGGSTQFNNLAFTVNGSRITYGGFLDALLSFLIVALVVFFAVIKPVNALMKRTGRARSETVRDCPQCLSKVPEAASRCAYCTSELSPMAPATGS
jgi:large conductance mechanosensitive channel